MPYQKAIPAGKGSINGTKDHRLWKFTDDPNYVTISSYTAETKCFICFEWLTKLAYYVWIATQIRI
jgi:hypothetical protein